jgi:hypothetical protein
MSPQRYYQGHGAANFASPRDRRLPVACSGSYFADLLWQLCSAVGWVGMRSNSAFYTSGS